MPIVIKRPPRMPPPTPTKPRPSRRRSDEAARTLAPVIAEIRKGGHHGVAEIAKCLNERGLRATSGEPYSYETTRKRLKAIERLGLGEGPRTASQALSARHEKASDQSEQVDRDSGAKRVRASRLGLTM